MLMEITINQNENQNISISNDNLQDININENDNQLININSNNPQDININENENQLILIGGGGEVIGITDVLVNGVTVVSGNIAYITVPTKTSELYNNSGYITLNDIPSETDPTVPSYVKAISLADINKWNNKQDELVSGSNIKTINNTSLLGSGNIDISGGEIYTAGTGIEINNGVINNTITNYNDLTDLPTIPNKTSDLINDEDFVSEDDLAEVAFTGSYNSLSDTPIIPDSTSDLINDSDFVNENLLNLRLLSKQDKLISGTNIKTVNNNSLLGSGNISINSTDVQINGASIVNNDVADIITESAYNSSTNKIATKNDIPSATSQLTNDSNFATTDNNNYFTAQQTFQQGLYTPQDLYIGGKFYTDSEPLGYTKEQTFTMLQNINGGSWELVTSEETLSLKKGYYIFIYYVSVSGNNVYVTLNAAVNQTRLENNYRISHNLEGGYNMSGNIVVPYYLASDSNLIFSIYGYANGSYNGAWGKIIAIKIN